MSQLVKQNVPMNDLKIQYAQIKSEIDAAMAAVVANTSFILGPQVAAFEQAWADYNDVKHCVGVSNGTDALKVALRALDVGAGDEVITTSFTFGATIEAICELGARPVFVDIEANYFSLDVGQVAERCTDKTKAIIPVHIYGHPVDIDPLLNLANERGIAVVEDAAQAHGARYREQAVGSLGKVGCFSFYPGKNLGAYGDAGGIISDDDELVGRMRQLRNHGQDPRRKFWYNDLGYNHRMDGLQGAVLEVKLRYLDQGNQRRRQVAARYDALADLEQVAVPLVADYAHHVYHLYVIRVPDRDALGTALKEEGVATAVQYPHPLHLTTAYEFLGYREGDLPVCEQACREIISLPMFADLEDGQVDYVVDCVRQYYA